MIYHNMIIDYIENDKIPDSYKLHPDFYCIPSAPQKYTIDLSEWIGENPLIKSVDLQVDHIDDIPKKDCIYFIDIIRITHLHYWACQYKGDGPGVPFESVNLLNTLVSLINDPSNKTVFYNVHRIVDINSFALFITHHLPERIYQVQPGSEHQASVSFVVSFSVDEDLLKNRLNTQLNVATMSSWIKEPMLQINRTDVESELILDNTKPNKRFSVFSRRIDNDRQQFFFNLVRKDIIDNCHYSFGTSHPDFFGEPEWTKTVEELKDAVPFIRKGNIFFINENEEDKTKKLYKWLEGTPYTLGSYGDIYDPILFQKIADSHIHIVIETSTSTNEIIATEKIGRAIALRKPFVVLGQPYVLNFLHQCGFKTFDPIIDEAYDTIENTSDRIRNITLVIEKFNNMPEQKLEDLMEQLKEITEENYQVLKSLTHANINPWFNNLGIFTPL
jgi:hypothetical protein